MKRSEREFEKKLYLDNWPRRRRWMLSILIWAVLNIQYLIFFGVDTGLHQNALVALLGLVGATIGSYVFGAVWDDNDKRRRMRRFHDRDLEDPYQEGGEE